MEALTPLRNDSSFLIDVSLHASFWLDVLCAAVFTINRLSTPVFMKNFPMRFCSNRFVIINFWNHLDVIINFWNHLDVHGFVIFFKQIKLYAQSIVCVSWGDGPHYKGYCCLISSLTVFMLVIMWFFTKTISPFQLWYLELPLLLPHHFLILLKSRVALILLMLHTTYFFLLFASYPFPYLYPHLQNPSYKTNPFPDLLPTHACSLAPSTARPTTSHLPPHCLCHLLIPPLFPPRMG